jgi:anti-sigma factor RsiW
MLKLMAYADGELDGAERKEVEGWLLQDADSARFANELAGLGELVRIGHKKTSEAKAVASFDVADLVMASVAAEQTKPVTISKSAAVSSLDAARARRQKNLRTGGIAVAALALAASVFLMTRNKDEQPMARAPIPAVQQPAASSGGVDVDVVQSPGSSVGVYYLPSESSLTTSVVVWVDEGEK